VVRITSCNTGRMDVSSSTDLTPIDVGPADMVGPRKRTEA
jgi:hypothetical protein